MIDGLNVSERREAFRAALRAGASAATGLTVTARPPLSHPPCLHPHPSPTPTPAPTTPTHTRTHPTQADDVVRGITRPVTILVSPMWGGFPSKPSPGPPGPPSADTPPDFPSAFALFTFPWDAFLSSTLGQRLSLEAVLSSSAENFNFSQIGSPLPVDTSSFTFRLNGLGENVTAVGWGDHHARGGVGDRYRRTVSVKVGLTDYLLAVRPSGGDLGFRPSEEHCPLRPAIVLMLRARLPRRSTPRRSSSTRPCPTCRGTASSVRALRVGSPSASAATRLLTARNDPALPPACVLLIFGIAAFFSFFSAAARRQYDAMHLRNASANAAFSAEQEKMRSQSAFVSMVSHEIRTPTAWIVGAVDLLLSSSGLTPAQLDMVVRPWLPGRRPRGVAVGGCGRNASTQPRTARRLQGMIREGSDQILTLIEARRPSAAGTIDSSAAILAPSDAPLPLHYTTHTHILRTPSRWGPTAAPWRSASTRA